MSTFVLIVGMVLSLSLVSMGFHESNAVGGIVWGAALFGFSIFCAHALDSGGPK